MAAGEGELNEPSSPIALQRACQNITPGIPTGQRKVSLYRVPAGQGNVRTNGTVHPIIICVIARGNLVKQLVIFPFWKSYCVQDPLFVRDHGAGCLTLIDPVVPIIAEKNDS